MSYLRNEERLVGMVKSPHRELELVRVVDHGFQVRHSIAVGVDVDLASERGTQRLPLQLLREVRAHVLDAHGVRGVAPVVLLAVDLGSLLERVAELPGLAQAADGAPLSDLAVDTLGVLAAGHLHVAPVPVGVRQHVLGGDLLAPVGLADGMLDHIGLAADVVARARQHQARGDASGLDDLDLAVPRLYAVDRAHIGSDVRGHLVGVRVAPQVRQRVDAGVAVHIDDTRRELAAPGVPDDGVPGQAGDGDVPANLLDETILDEHVRGDPLEALACARVRRRRAGGGLPHPDGGVPDERGLVAVDVARVPLTAQADGVRRLRAQPRAHGEVLVQLGDGEAVATDGRGAGAAVSAGGDLPPLGVGEERQEREDEQTRCS